MFKKAISTIILAALLICPWGNIVDAAYTPAVLGDVNADGLLSSADWLKIKNFLLRQNELYEAEFLKADIDGDRMITSTDYLQIKKMLVYGSDKKAVNLYVQDEQAYHLVPKIAYFDGSIEGLVSELEKARAIPVNTKVSSFSIESKTAYIDLSEEFGKALEKGTTEETMILGSLVNTVIRCYNVENVVFTVEGELLTTGHNCYDFPLGFQSITWFYVSDDNSMYFEALEGNFNGTINGLIERLADFGHIPNDVKVNSFSILNGIAYIDLSEEFGKALETGTTEEAIITGSLANTVIKYYNVEKVQFTVDGKIFKSGHVDYDFPLGFSETVY